MSDKQTPAYPSKATLAHELDCAESTIDELVRRGILPKPVRLTPGVVRWCWHEVQLAVASLKSDTTADPYMAGIAKIDDGDEGNDKKKGKGSN